MERDADVLEAMNVVLPDVLDGFDVVRVLEVRDLFERDVAFWDLSA